MKDGISKNDALSLRLTVYGTCVLMLLAAMGQFVQVGADFASWGHVIFGVLFVANSYGLFRLKSWARMTTVVILGLFVVLSIVGVFNPFMASDFMASGTEPPSVLTLSMFVLPVVVLLVLMLHILGKYKSSFR